MEKELKRSNSDHLFELSSSSMIMDPYLSLFVHLLLVSLCNFTLESALSMKL